MKKYIVLIILIFLFTVFLFYENNNCYQTKIEIKFNNLSCKEIDRRIASDVKDKITQLNGIVDIVIFSRENICTIYCKIFPFAINKRQISDEIERRLNKALQKFDDISEVNFNDEYHIKYHSFMVISTKNRSYKYLKYICDIIEDELLACNLSRQILNLGEQTRCAYIYFNNDTLTRYNLDIQQIKDIITKNNILKSSTTKTNEKNSYAVNINSNFKSIDDIKNTTLTYKDKSFSTKLKDVFKIEEKSKFPSDGYIFEGDKKAQIFAISKKRFYPTILFNYRLHKFKKYIENNYSKEIDINLYSTSRLKKIEIYLDNSASVENGLGLYKKIQKKLQGYDIKDVVYFIGFNPPKTKNGEYFEEREKNKITLFSSVYNFKRIKNALKENNIGYFDDSSPSFVVYSYHLDDLYEKIQKLKQKFENIHNTTTYKTLQIDYTIDDYGTNDYLISKEEVIDSIICANDGLIFDSYWDDTTKIPIILKNENALNRTYIFSKDYKNLINLNSIAKSSLSNDFSVIARKNQNYFAILTKQPK